MNETTAKEIIEAFGPCSMHQECLTPAELVKDFAECGGYTLRKWLDLRLTVEEVFWDREHEGSERSDAKIKEHQKFIAAIRKRVKALPCYTAKPAA